MNIGSNRTCRICCNLVVMLIVAATIGCGDDLDIPAPGADARAIPPLEPSTITIPIAIPLKPIYAEIERTIPREQRTGSEWSVVGHSPVGDVGAHYEVWRDSLRITFVEGRL